MFVCAQSGQFLFFTLVNISGAVQTAASGAISGRKLADSNAMALLSGNIVETSGGTYRANLYDWDTSGRNIAYLFTASGCLPIMYNVTTTLQASGRSYSASGVHTVVPPATLSGVVANSGLTVGIPIAALSGVVANSGLTVTVVKDALSGVVANSGLTVGIPIAVLSGVVANSGLVVSVPIASISGNVGSSGLTVNVVVATLSGVVGASGIFAQVPIASLSGITPASGLWVASGALSGQPVLPVGTINATIIGP